MEEIDLSDMSFDFEDYFERFRSGEMSEEEKDEFDARVLGLFCQSFIKSKGNPAAIPKWVAGHMCEQIYKVLAGLQFADAFRMPEPWQQPTPIWSRAEQDALGIFCDVANALRSDASLKITDAISDAARRMNCSYEKARAAYYTHKNLTADVPKRDAKN